MAEYKLDPPTMGKVLCEAARLRAAEFLQNCQENELPFLRDSLINHAFFYNFAFMKETLLRKHPAAVVEETMGYALEEYFQQFVQHSPSDDLADLRAMAREDAAVVRHFLEATVHGDKSALYRLAKKFLQDICSLEGSPLLGADKILEASLTIALWMDCAYLNDVYDIVPASHPSEEGAASSTPYGHHPPNPLRKHQKPAPGDGGAPASASAPAAPAPAGPGPGPVPASAAPAAAVPVQPPAAEAPAAPSGKAFGWKPLARSAACLLVLALVFCGGYAMGKRSTPEKDPDWYEWKSYGVSSSQTWVYVSRTGTKYHRTSSCSNMDVPIYTTLDEAVSLGYTRCSKCW